MSELTINARKTQRLAAVPSLVPKTATQFEVSGETVDELVMLLAAARTGNITGIAFAATLLEGRFLTRWVGECVERPAFTRGLLSVLNDELGAQIEDTHIDDRR